MTFQDRQLSILEAAEKKVGAALPSLWILWNSEAAGPKLWAEARVAILDVGCGLPIGALVGRAMMEWKAGNLAFEDPERLNDALLALFDLRPPEVMSPVKKAIYEMQMTRLEKGLRGEMDLHEKRVVDLGKRLRTMAETEAVPLEDLIKLVAGKAEVPEWVLSRLRIGNDKIITQHLDRVNSALRKLEASHAG